jgi:hypothetical protein
MLKTKQQSRSVRAIDTATHAECLEFIRAAIAEGDREFAGHIAAILKEVCENGHADRAAIWNDLTPSEQTEYRSLLAPPPIAPSLQFTIGDQAKVSPEYIGTKEFRGKLTTIIEVYSDGLCRIEFDSEIEISGCQSTKATNINGQYLIPSSKRSPTMTPQPL